MFSKANYQNKKIKAKTHTKMPQTTSKRPAMFLRSFLLVGGVFFAVCLGTILKLQPGQATAATNATVNFQARLMASSGSIVGDGDYNVEFKLYNALTSSGSSQGSCTGDAACLWTETRTTTNKVRVVNGYLTVDLGSVTAFPSTINWDQNLYLTMNIGGTGTASWDGEMSPRLKLTAVPYAFRAGQLATLNGSNAATLGFVQPTANRSILLPDESGTLCIQSSANCGFALSTGSGSYIQNGTSLQSGANFNISGTGTAATSLQAPLLDTASAVALNIGTTNATGINLNKSTTITGGISQSGGTISLTGNAASSITTSTGALTLTAAGTSNWTVGGTNQSLTITTSGTGVLTLGTTGAGTVTVGSNSAIVNIGTTNAAHTVHIADGGTSTTQAVTIGSKNSGSSTTIQGGTASGAIALSTGTNGIITIDAQGSGGITGNTGSTGFALKSTTNSSTAFAIQAANNDYIFTVSTSGGIVTMGAIQATYSSFDGTLNTPLGNLTLGSTTNATKLLGSSGMTIQATSGSFTTTLSFTAPTANRSIVVPDEAGTLCMRNSTNCGFAATSGSANYIQNTTTAQSANMYVQAASSGSVAGVLRANAAGAGDILDLKNGAGTNIATFGSTGAVFLQNSTDSGNAFQIQNTSNTALFNVSTSTNGLITMGTALRLNVTSTNADTFTTPLSSSVKTAINIPLYDPGAAGQILAFGLPSTANATARGISVFDARSAGVIQPAIAVFSPNENDVFGLSWNGLNTVASLETGSAAIALRPGGTNVKLWAGSTGVAIGSNVSSASYPLDVTGDVNTSTQYRIAGTVICTSTGCTPAAGSSNYIQNTATVQSANMYVQAATSGSVGAVIRANAAGAGDILDLKNGAGTNIATFGSTGAVLLQNSTDSATAFVISSSTAGTNQNVFRVDTVSERVAIGVVGGTPSAKLNIATGSTVGLRVFDSGAYNSLELANATANTMSVDQNGLTLHKTTTNSVNAFQVQNATTGTAFNVDTTNLRVGIGGVTTPAVSLDVQGGIQQTGLTTSNTAGTDANKWTLMGTCTITAQFRQCVSSVNIMGGFDGNAGDNTQATVSMRVKQQNAMAGAPYVNITMNDTAEVITKNDIVAVTTQNDATATVVQLYGRITNGFEQWYFAPNMNPDQSPSKWVWSQSAGFLAALPGGTQTAAVYGDSYSNTLTVQPAANVTNAFQVKNAAGTNTAFSVDSGNLRVAVGGTFNPQETMDVVGNLQVRDATTATKSYRLRTSGGGLDFEGAGANLVLSMWSGAGYTGTQYNQITFKNDGSSMDFARGFNVSSGTAKVGLGGNTNPQYALDVTGEINASVGLRVNGTTVCDTTGSTGCIAKSGSGYYIHNQTTQQTANLNMISAATNSITALFQGASGQTANVLQVNDGSSNALLTVGSSTVTIGNGGNTVTFGSGFEPTLAGNARHQKSLVLTPEYAGAVLDATNDATCSSANSGTMTSALDLTNRVNYYKWISASGSAQCYDVVVQVQVPSDWTAWNGVPTVGTYSSNTTNGTMNLEIRDTAGTVETNNNFVSITPSTTTTWQTKNGGAFAGTYTAGSVMTLRIRMSSLSSAETRLGNITLNYYSKY
jgi:hypothetical protein